MPLKNIQNVRNIDFKMLISVLFFAINYSFMCLLMKIKYKSYSIYYSRKCEKCPKK